MATKTNTDKVEQWGMFELMLEGSSAGNPYLDVELTAQFSQGDRLVNVFGFYDGDGVYRVRFMPDTLGEWHYETQCNRSAVTPASGTFTCVAADPGNHGPVRVANDVHFAYADGTRYVPVGTTCYVWNLQGDALEEQTLKTLNQTPFNKMRMCVFPKRFPYNQNEPPSYPFSGKPKEWDFSHFNPQYFQHLEQRILDLQARGIEADLILFHPYDWGAWGFDRMPIEVNDRYLRYLVTRLAAMRNVWWSFANEYDCFFDRTTEEWDHYIQLVQELDPYNHLRSIHNLGKFYDPGKPWVTHCSIQHSDTGKTIQWLKKYNKPVVIDECGYEGDIGMTWGDLSAEEMVIRFWRGFAQGGYVGHGETYVNDEEVLWWSKGGQLHGESVPRIAFLRQILEAAPPLTPVSIGDADRESLDLSIPQVRARLFDRSAESGEDQVIKAASWNIDAGGYNAEEGYYLFYYALHQPRIREFNLPTHSSYSIDLLDTWNMTVETAAEKASGKVRVAMPGRKQMAIRIRRQ
ncbi:MAG: DUF5060 domain-containing protein [Caldilineaceae bacterium]